MSVAVQKAVEAEMKKSLEALANELSKIRTGRANVQMLDAIRVDYYGSQSPISQVAAVSCPDARSFLISPWETTVLKETLKLIPGMFAWTKRMNRKQDNVPVKKTVYTKKWPGINIPGLAYL